MSNNKEELTEKARVLSSQMGKLFWDTIRDEVTVGYAESFGFQVVSAFAIASLFSMHKKFCMDEPVEEILEKFIDSIRSNARHIQEHVANGEKI